MPDIGASRLAMDEKRAAFQERGFVFIEMEISMPTQERSQRWSVQVAGSGRLHGFSPMLKRRLQVWLDRLDSV
jgi:hypothetical protein